jgi:transcriptional regulator
MYVPKAFEQHDREQLFAFMRANSFATLVSQHEGQPFATHLPLLVDAEAGEQGELHGHFARANPHWRDLAGQDVLMIFSGPHAYVSPTWYGVPKMVPTWNYLAVHAYGRCELMEDAGQLLDVLARTAATYEHNQAAPWSFSPDDPTVQKLLNGIVGFRLKISRLEGKWKLGQNHPPQVRSSAAAELARSSDPQAREIASLMTATLAAE